MIPIRLITAACLLWLTCAGAYAQQQVVVVTSFPKELTEAYKNGDFDFLGSVARSLKRTTQMVTTLT